MIEPSFPALLQRFFSGRRCAQLVASLHTVASSRDTFRLFLVFAAARLGRPPSRLCIEQLDALLVGVLLDHLERDRGNSARTCNSRLSALRAFFRYVAFSELARALQCLRSLATPSKRHQRRDVTFSLFSSAHSSRNTSVLCSCDNRSMVPCNFPSLSSRRAED